LEELIDCFISVHLSNSRIGHNEPPLGTRGVAIETYGQVFYQRAVSLFRFQQSFLRPFTL
jgi:hypothetical protein